MEKKEHDEKGKMKMFKLEDYVIAKAKLTEEEKKNLEMPAGFVERYGDNYEFLYTFEENNNGKDPYWYYDVMNDGDRMVKEYDNIIKEYWNKCGDIFTSDRQIVSFAMTMYDFGIEGGQGNYE